MNAYKVARKRPNKPPKGWKKNKGKCRLRVIPLRMNLSGQEALIFFCVKKHHWHGERHPIMKTLRPDDIVVSRKTLYAEMLGSAS